MKPTVSDKSLREQVEKELEDDPEIYAKHISVTVSDGAVTLGGHVSSNHEKHAAVRLAEGIPAVKVVADDIEVREPALHERADDEIAEEIAHVRGLHPEDPDSVLVQVRDGHVFLRGQVPSESLKEFIVTTARGLTGVRGVTDLLEVAPSESSDTDVEQRVQAAIATEGDPQAQSVRATLTDGLARLSGQVSTLAALEKALHAAESAPGVTSVESEIVIAPPASSGSSQDTQQRSTG
jgi:osmotically-inducible protein OsmY